MQTRTLPTPASSTDLAPMLDSLVQDAIRDSWSPHTRRAYNVGWRIFGEWCDAQGVNALPASSDDVARFAADRAQTVTPATVKSNLSAIAFAHRARGHESPCKAEIVRRTLSGITRRAVRNGQTPKQARPLLPEMLPALARVTNIRDYAMLAIMCDAGLRAAEASALTWGDVETAPDGSGRVTVRYSKGDQEGDGGGAVVAVTLGAVAAIEAYREADGIDTSPAARIFPITPKQIRWRIKRAGERAGFDISGHSPRVGLAQRMTRAGAATHVTAKQGRWKSLHMVTVYTRNLDAAGALPYLT